MFKNKVLFLVFMASWFIPGPGYAQYCPKTIAAIEGGPLSIKSTPIIAGVYKELGCTLEIKFLPGRRGILEFNNSNVDGELFRLPLIEDKYTKEFVRSLVPIIKINNSIWSSPSHDLTKTKPMGYTLGIVWQEKFISDNFSDQQSKILSFPSAEHLYEAYNLGNIGSFLAESHPIGILVTSGGLKPTPILSQKITTSYLYHYLDEKYSNFMIDFSTYLSENSPFSELP